VEGTESLSVIDTLSAGFDTINKRPWLVVLPVVLDLYLWQGPQLSILPIVQQLVYSLRGLPQASFSGVPPSVVAETLQEMGQGLNLFSLLHNGLMGVPSLIAWAASELGGTHMGNVIQIEGWANLLLISTGLLLLGVLIGSVYLVLITVAVRRESVALWDVWRRIWRCWGWVILWGLVLFAVILLLNLGVSLVALPVALISQAAGQGLFGLLWVLSVGLGVWLSLNTFFTLQALVLQDIGLAQAVWRSFNIVRRNFWSTLGLILLSLLIQLGFGQIWQRLSSGSWQTLLSILGNAYIGSGVMAAIMIFYMDRFGRWQEEQRNRAGDPAGG
jgi:hypothetical protein